MTDTCPELAGVRRIVVHGGLAHMDDIMACAIAYAFGVPHDATIERRNPTPEELASTTVLVLDVGGRHDPSCLDFDHHRRSRDDEPKCAYTLLAEWLGAADELKMLFPWYEIWNLIDVLGPFATSRRLGVAWESMEGLVENPLGDYVIRHFADDPQFRCKVARSLANGMNLTRRSWAAIGGKVVRKTVQGFLVGDFTQCAAEEVSRCSDTWIRLNRPACVVSRDSRGKGLTLLRCNDDPRLDFARCAGRPYALFAHPGGFVLKTQALTDDLGQILADARVADAS